MSQEITVDTGLLANDINSLQNLLNNIKKDMDKMYDAVEVLNGMWDGEANEAFNQQFSQDHNDMKELCDTVQRIIDCLEYAKKEYNTCETEISSIISAISV